MQGGGNKDGTRSGEGQQAVSRGSCRARHWDCPETGVEPAGVEVVLEDSEPNVMASLGSLTAPVQAAGRSREGEPGRGGDGGGGGEGPVSFLRTPALLSPPGPPVFQSQGRVASASLCRCRKSEL